MSNLLWAKHDSYEKRRKLEPLDRAWRQILRGLQSEQSRTMAYTLRNTVDRLARNELNLNPVVLEQSKEK